MKVTDNNGLEMSFNAYELAISWLLIRNGLPCNHETYSVAVDTTDPSCRLITDAWVYASESEARQDYDGSGTLGVIHDIGNDVWTDE